MARDVRVPPTGAPDADALAFAEQSITPWQSAGCDPPRLDYPRWIGFPVRRCAYTDLGATVHTYMLNADRHKLAVWTVIACNDASASDVRACVRWLTSEMQMAASYSVFSVAGYVPEPESGGLCFLFRDGVTVWTSLRPHFRKPDRNSCGGNEAKNMRSLVRSGQFARVASTTRAEYTAVHPTIPGSGLHWVDVTRSEYQKAWTSNRNELISVRAIVARQHGRF